MFHNPRTRALLGAGTALVVVTGIGIGVATSSAAASPRFVTAVASTGDVTQTYTATGTISREGTVEAAFAVDGTVRRVDVAVGDEVEAGDTLAVLDRADLRLAVLEAETAVARAKASLYAAQHPASSSSAGTGSGSGSPSGSGGTGVSVDAKLLAAATSRVNLAVLAEAEACTAIFDAILPAAEPTAEPTATASADQGDATSVPSASASATLTGSASAPAGPQPSGSPTADASPAAEPEPTASASGLAAVGDPDVTAGQLQACADARAEVLAANENLQAFVLTATGPKGAPAPAGSAKSSSAGSGATSVSAAAVASAKAGLLEAEQELAAAQADLAAAELVAPISGTIGAVGVAKGDGASTGTITVVGTGSAVVTLELPLATRELVSVGQEVGVTPAGSTTALTGRITAIATLATDGTSGDTATYTTTVSVSDPDGRLAGGANAAVLVPVKTAASVLRVPGSAVTPTGPGTATIQVVGSAGDDTAGTVPVQTGAVGGGWVQVTSGLQAGQLVVLADNTADLPSNTSTRRLTTGSAAVR